MEDNVPNTVEHTFQQFFAIIMAAAGVVGVNHHLYYWYRTFRNTLHKAAPFYFPPKIRLDFLFLFTTQFHEKELR